MKIYKSIKIKPLLISLLISLGVGGLSAFFTKSSRNIYENLKQPSLAPPSIVFPIVWTILFILMGISAYIIFKSDSELKSKALTIYAIQLIVNFFWPIIFFNMKMYLFAFIWLVLLWIWILLMIISFNKINKTAGLLQIPYFLWVTFAGYLNLMTYILNR